MWVSSAGNAYETVKSIVWAKMVSGRYGTKILCRFWSTNRSGVCLAETCQNVPGTLEHLLIECPAELKKVGSTGRMLLEHQMLFPGTHDTRTHIKDVLSMALYYFKQFFLIKLLHL